MTVWTPQQYNEIVMVKTSSINMMIWRHIKFCTEFEIIIELRILEFRVEFVAYFLFKRIIC